jgi:hypothetical protein
MRGILRLVFVAVAFLPGMALAQAVDGQFRSPISPPPLPHSPQNPLGGSTPASPSTPGKPGQQPRRPAPGGNGLTGLVGYLDSEMQDGPDDLDVPVTGYGNEVLWDDNAMLASEPQG